ncbi:hypothetical protein BASA61_006078 [Batrachochytrium salamandrivorans]|nr:hypothetical protein BASA60_002526 [Batrachochytrium salamandrivorans]KAH6588173.1 hypothetical protein BASA61_006078 [Batrachochytrium salamandrivorans]
MVLPSPSSSLFERSMSALVTNFRGHLGDDLSGSEVLSQHPLLQQQSLQQQQQHQQFLQQQHHMQLHQTQHPLAKSISASHSSDHTTECASPSLSPEGQPYGDVPAAAIGHRASITSGVLGWEQLQMQQLEMRLPTALSTTHTHTGNSSVAITPPDRLPFAASTVAVDSSIQINTCSNSQSKERASSHPSLLFSPRLPMSYTGLTLLPKSVNATLTEQPLFSPTTQSFFKFAKDLIDAHPFTENSHSTDTINATTSNDSSTTSVSGNAPNTALGSSIITDATSSVPPRLMSALAMPPKQQTPPQSQTRSFVQPNAALALDFMAHSGSRVHNAFDPQSIDSTVATATMATVVDKSAAQMNLGYGQVMLQQPLLRQHQQQQQQQQSLQQQQLQQQLQSQQLDALFQPDTTETAGNPALQYIVGSFLDSMTTIAAEPAFLSDFTDLAPTLSHPMQPTQSQPQLQQQLQQQQLQQLHHQQQQQLLQQRQAVEQDDFSRHISSVTNSFPQIDYHDDMLLLGLDDPPKRIYPSDLHANTALINPIKCASVLSDSNTWPLPQRALTMEHHRHMKPDLDSETVRRASYPQRMIPHQQQRQRQQQTIYNSNPVQSSGDVVTLCANDSIDLQQHAANPLELVTVNGLSANDVLRRRFSFMPSQAHLPTPDTSPHGLVVALEPGAATTNISHTDDMNADMAASMTLPHRSSLPHVTMVDPALSYHSDLPIAAVVGRHSVPNHQWQPPQQQRAHYVNHHMPHHSHQSTTKHSQDQQQHTTPDTHVRRLSDDSMTSSPAQLDHEMRDNTTHYNVQPEAVDQNDPSFSETTSEGQGSVSVMFPCSFSGCTRRFSKASSLQNHLSSHSSSGKPKPKPYRCEMCPQTFSRSHDLKRHYYIHSQDKPHMCRRCGKGFSRRDALKRHQRSVLEGKKVHCNPLHPNAPMPTLSELESDEDE